MEKFEGETRDVTFVANGDVSLTWTQTLSFTHRTASFTLADIPDGVTSISAKADWNLRVKLDVELIDGQATVDFTGNNLLMGGDLNGTNSTNILDFAIIKNDWFTSNAVADINGDGIVNMQDFLMLRKNWFLRGDDL